MKTCILDTRVALGLLIVLYFLTSPINAQQPSVEQPAATCQSEHHKAFDFWLGEWRVTTADGTHAGDNSLVKIQNGCVMMENWRSASSAFTGTSFNFFNQQTKMWEQLWLDNQGGHLHLRGNAKDNTMVLRSEEQENDDGQLIVNQITWTNNPDGSVRQQWLALTKGEEGRVVFDGLYQRSEERSK